MNNKTDIIWSVNTLDNYVIKIGFRREDAYNAYVAYCRVRQGQEGIPNIHFSKQANNGNLVTFLDKLQPIDADINIGLVNWVETIKDKLNKRIPCTCSACAQGIVLAGIFRNSYSNHKALEETLCNILGYFEDLSAIDLHEGNIMVNSEGTVYFTDPVSYTTSYLKRGGYR